MRMPPTARCRGRRGGPASQIGWLRRGCAPVADGL